MSISTDKNKKLFNDINITPLTDIFLVLLIIMMVVAPTFQTIDNDIQVPEINSGINIEAQECVTLAISAKGRYYLDKKEINPKNLTSELQAVIENLKEKKVVVKADKNVKSKEIIKVVKAAQASGYEKLTVAGEPLSKKQQDELQSQQGQQEKIEE